LKDCEPHWLNLKFGAGSVNEREFAMKRGRQAMAFILASLRGRYEALMTRRRSGANSAVQPGIIGTQHVARVVLVTFLFTFVVSRMLVYLIMSRRLPDLFVHVGGTHIHHLNYGIVLLAGVGGYLLFGGSAVRPGAVIAVLYGVGLALTFDEFGMWLHLNDEYWQRASFDAVVVITAVLSLLVVTPRWHSLRPRHWVTAAALGVVLILFTLLFLDSLRYANTRLAPLLRELQERQPR
jgi:hypothetical protein